MKLFILRHGEAIPNFMDDEGRQLTERGQLQSLNQGKRLADVIGRVDLMAVSPLVRAQQTADAVEQHLTVASREVWPELLHGGTAQIAEDKLCVDSYNTVLFVSHMPLVASLESYLISADPMTGKPFQTAEVSALESSECYPGAWQLLARYPAHV